MPIRAAWSCPRLVHLASMDVMPLLPSMRCIPTVANINRCLDEVVAAVLYKVIQSSHPYPTVKNVSHDVSALVRDKNDPCVVAFAKALDTCGRRCKWKHDVQCQEALRLLWWCVVVAANMLLESCIFFSYLTCLYVEGTCGAEGSLQAPEPAWGICSFLLHEHTASFYITWASCFHSPSWQPALSRPLSVVYTNYIIFIREKSFLSTSILEKQTNTSKSQRRGEKWVTCYYTAVRRFRVYFLFVPWHLCSSSTYQITYQMQTLPHIFVFTCPD